MDLRTFVIAAAAVCAARCAGSAPGSVYDRVRSGIVGEARRSRTADREVFVRRPDDTPFTELVAVVVGSDGRRTERILVPPRSMVDRAAISPDGAWVAYVDGVTGLASVWVIAFDGGGDPVQLTNLGVRPAKGGPPDGFVPPPSAPPVFDGDALRWTDADGAPGAVRWR